MSQEFGTSGLSCAPKRRSQRTQRIFLHARMSTVRIFESFSRWVRRPTQQITPKPFNIVETSRRNIRLCFLQSMHLSIRPEMEEPSQFQKKPNTDRWRISMPLETSTQTRTTRHSDLLSILIRPIFPEHQRLLSPSDCHPRGFHSACKSQDSRLANRRCAGSAMLTRKQPAGTRSTRMSSCGAGFGILDAPKGEDWG